MPEKRARSDGADPPPAKKQRKGFQVGPANLPDGSWRRKNDRIKADLIEKARIKKEYAKIKQREQPAPPTIRYEDGDGEEHPPQTQRTPASLELHPDRQSMLTATDASRQDDQDDGSEGDVGNAAKPARRNTARRQKPAPFGKETRHAQRRQQEADERAEQWEKSRRERAQRLEERERFRRTMAKARAGGRNGQRKLGRESSVLLAKVKRMVGQA